MRIVRLLFGLGLSFSVSLLGFGRFASVKNQGMGGVGTAYPADTLSAAYNPAGIVYLGNRADLGVHWFNEQFSHTLPGGETRYASRQRNHYWPELGASCMVCGSCDVAAGVIAYVKNDLHHSFPNEPARPCFSYIHGVISPIVALRISCHSFGISGNFHGHIFKGRLSPPLPDSVDPDNLTDKDYDNAGGITITVGWMGQVLPCLTMGFSYETKTIMRRLHRYAGLWPSTGNLDLPERYRVGWTKLFCDGGYAISLDLEYIKWHDVKGWQESTTASGINGAEDGPGLGWHNQVGVHVGVDVRPFDNLLLRAGYHYASTPISGDTGLAELPLLAAELEEQAVTFGFTYCTVCDVELSAYYHFGFRNSKVTVNNSLTTRRQSAGIALGWKW